MSTYPTCHRAECARRGMYRPVILLYVDGEQDRLYRSHLPMALCAHHAKALRRLFRTTRYRAELCQRLMQRRVEGSPNWSRSLLLFYRVQ